MTTALEVLVAFLNGDADCYGEDFILNNGVLYYQSKDWPLAVFNDGGDISGQIIYINGSQRTHNYNKIINDLALTINLRGYVHRFSTLEGIKLMLEDKKQNPTEFNSLQKQLNDEKSAHEAAQQQLNTVIIERDALKAEIAKLKAANPPPKA